MAYGYVTSYQTQSLAWSSIDRLELTSVAWLDTIMDKYEDVFCDLDKLILL